jgi:hypothetical protein
LNRKFLLLIFHLPLTVAGQQSDKTLLNLKGEVMSTETFMYWEDDTTKIKEVESQNFNQYGYLLSEESYFDDSMSYYIKTWSLDSNNHIISSKTVSHKRNRIPSEFKYFYEGDNLVKSVSQHDEGKEVFEYSYNNENIEIAMKHYWNGRLEYSRETITLEDDSPDTLRQFWHNRGEQVTVFLTPVQADTCVTLVCENDICRKNIVIRDSLGNDITLQREMEDGEIELSSYKY